MNVSDRITTLKPYIVGGVVGAVAVIAVGFSADWLVTTGTMHDQVSQARIDAFAQICEQDATAHWKNQGKEMAALDGWRNEARTALAEQFSANLSTDKSLDKAIQSRCDSLLEPV